MTKYEHYYAVIMAGGGGTRLWPLSRKERPKQALSLVDDRSMFRMAVERLQGVFPPERIFVVTVEEQAALLREQYPDIPAENFLLEPLPRGTASVVGLAAMALQHRDPEAVMAILTADHVIQKEGLFRDFLRTAYEVAQDEYLVTMGINPTHPATGYGYIQIGEPLGKYRDQEVSKVIRFTEKPDRNQAEQMLFSGDYAWNSGMFFWKVETILSEFARQMPELKATLDEIDRAWGTEAQEEVLRSQWASIVPETIDYGIMENAQNVAVIPAQGLGWSDVGSWAALYEVLAGKGHENVVQGGEYYSLDSEGNLIHAADHPRMVVTIGLDDLVVVDTEDVLLICNRKEAQRVREIVQRLEEESRDTYL
jgi:mannose-1-phosphate guanylyltransferase